MARVAPTHAEPVVTTDSPDFRAGVAERLEKALAAVEPNATYDQMPSVSDYMKMPAVEATMFSIVTGTPVRIIGEPGIGKTAVIEYLCELLGFRCVMLLAAQMSPEDVTVAMPFYSEKLGRKALYSLLYGEMSTDRPKIVVIDDLGRAHPSVNNILMELLQQKSIGGKPIPKVAAMIVTDNPQDDLTGSLSTMDLAVADRCATWLVTAADTPWPWALASKFPELDLTKLVESYFKLTTEVRRVLSPRVLEWMITLGQESLPLMWALPIVNGVRLRLTNKAHTDVTDETLTKVATALGVPNRESVHDPLPKVLDFVRKYKVNAYIEGAPGVGKTAWITSELKRLGIETTYLSAPAMNRDDLMVPMPTEDENGVPYLEMLVHEHFVKEGDWVLVIDEIYRGNRRLISAVMPILNERRVGSLTMDRLLGTVALNNPRTVAGYKLDVGKNDLPVASRFAVSVQVSARDIPWSLYLYNTYGESVSAPFVEWWQEDIDDVGRVLVTPRTLERMIQLYLDGRDIEHGLSYVNGEFVGVKLHHLHTRLEKRPVARLRKIIEDIDDWLARLSEGEIQNPEAHAHVYMALANAELPQLEEFAEPCLRLLRVLGQQHKINLLRQTDRAKYWVAQMKLLQKPKSAVT